MQARDAVQQFLAHPRTRLLLPWLITGTLVLAASWVITGQILLLTGWQRAIWVSVEATAPDPAAPPPAIALATDNAARLPMPVVWDNSRELMQIGVQPISMTQPLQILGITTTRGALPLDQLQIPPVGWQYQAAPSAVLVSQAGLMTVAASSPTTTLTLAAGPGAGVFALDWLDQHTEINLDAQPSSAYTLTLGLPVTYRGWVLLPPEQIRQLRVLLPATRSATLQRVTVFDATQRRWDTERLAALAQTAGCSTQLGTSTACQLDLPDIGTLNGVPRRLRGSVWLGLTLLGLLGCWLLAALARRLRRWHAGYELLDTPTGIWLRQHTTVWTRLRAAGAVAAVAICYHLAYASFVLVRYMSDSLGYYFMGWRLRSMWSLDAVFSRTPGYPLFLASLIWGFGHQVYGIVLVQHLALALLGPAVAWFLHPRTNSVFATIGGLLAGICPAIAITGNIIWTEAIFTVATCLSLLVLLGQRRHRDTLLAGLPIGIATMIRPNGLVLLALAFGGLFLRWWCADTRIQQLRASVTTGVVLLAGYLTMTMPSYLHCHAIQGYWSLTSLECAPLAPAVTPAHVQQVMSRTEFAAVINMADTQKLSLDTFAINRPYQASYRDYTLTNRAGGVVFQVVPDPVLSDNRYATEAVRESIRAQPRKYLRNLYEALLFNLFDTRPAQPEYAIYGELHDALPNLGLTEFVQQYAPLGDPAKTQALLAKPIPEPEDVDALLSQVSFRWSPPAAPVRALLLWTSRTTLDHWWLLVVLAFSGLVPGALFGPCRPVIFLLAYCLLMIVAPASIGMGVERYVMVIEPVLYACAALSLYAVLCLRLRRRTLVPSVAARSLLPEPGQ